jgi:hypothetical protein
MTKDYAIYTEGRHVGQSMYRAALVRELGGTRTLCICGQNPSKAEADDPTKNDPTILREIGFARRLGFGRLVKVNTSTRRSTDPKEYYRWLDSLTGVERLNHRDECYAIILREARAANMFLAAWGNCDGDGWPYTLSLKLAQDGVDIYALGFTNGGAPKHTLARGTHRIPDDTKPVLWRKGVP